MKINIFAPVQLNTGSSSLSLRKATLTRFTKLGGGGIDITNISPHGYTCPTLPVCTVDQNCWNTNFGCESFGCTESSEICDDIYWTQVG